MEYDIFTPEERKFYETSVIPLAIYQYVEEEIQPLLVSDELCVLMGVDRETLIERFRHNMYENVQEEDVENLIQAAVLFAKEKSDYDVIYRERMGQPVRLATVHAVGTHIYREDGRRIAVVRYENLTAAASATRTLQEVIGANDQAVDPLTGLPDRSSFERKAPEKIRKIFLEGGQPICIFYDIAGMKMFNAQYGFERGDTLLCRVGELLEKNYEHGLIARFGDDHYCILDDLNGLADIAEKLCHDLDHMPELGKIDLKGGGCLVDNTEISVSVLVDDAKFACDSIRHEAGVNFRLYDEELAKRLADNKFISENIDYAIEKDEIQVFYQPIIRTLTGQLCGFEALARWKSERLGFLSPGLFIPALENTHQIHKLDIYVINQVCKEYRDYVDRGHTAVPVSFNLSRLDFRSANMYDVVMAAADKYDVPHSMLRVEITESMAAEDEELIHREIARFREAGFQVWMDDFGSGHSSLNTLKDFDFQKLKIDMIFLSSFTDKSKAILRSVVQMAKRIGLRTLAEGVETAEQFEYLRTIGCEEVQGYYFGRPLPMEESFQQLMEKDIYAENPEMVAYYNQAGRVEMRPDVPIALVERVDDRFRFMFINERYAHILRGSGMDRIETAADPLNEMDSPYFYPFRERIDQSRQEGGEVRFAFSFRGTYLTMGLNLLSEKGDRQILQLQLSGAQMQLPKDELASETPAKPANPMESVMAETFEAKRKVLIADDEPINSMMLGEMLKDNYDLVYAENGRLAYDILKQQKHNIAAVLLDMVMPEMDGMELLRHMREESDLHDIPVIGMTSATDLEENILRAGATQFMPKPFEPAAIVLAKVDNVIHAAEERRSLAFQTLEHLPGGMFIYRAEGDGQILYANQATLNIFECQSYQEFMDLTGGTFKGMVHPGDYERVDEEIWSQIRDSEDKQDHVYYRIQTKNGGSKDLDDFGHLVDDPEMGQVFYVFIGTDTVSDRVLRNSFSDGWTASESLAKVNCTQEEAQDALSFLSMVFDVARIVDAESCHVERIHADGRITPERDHCFKVWNKNNRCRNCISARAYDRKTREVKFEIMKDEIYMVMAQYMEIDGQPYVMELVHHVDHEMIRRALGYQEFIDDMRNMSVQLYADSLTGEKNRRFYDEQLLAMQCDAVAMIDLDHFKPINDTFGHRAGDLALKRTVEAIRACIREKDLITRCGGDEFVLTFEQIPQDVFHAKLEQIRQRVENTIVEEYPDIDLHVSIGGIFSRGRVGDLVVRADEALYKAKQTRNTVHIVE